MAGDWQRTTLAELSSDVSYGYTESASIEKVGPRFLRITDIQNGVVNWDDVPFCPISKDNHGKYKLHDGDIVVARTGNSTGENFLYQGDEDAVFASYLIRFRIERQKADPKFVWYNLRSRTWWDFINNSKTGSAQAGANAKVLGMFPVCQPPIPEQRAIAHILGMLDDKIELNRRSNATLEAMARALFKDWFVDFGPVRAKREGRQPYLAPELWSQFPAEFGDSETPAGWLDSTLGTEVRKANGLIQTGPFGSQLHASDYAVEGIPVVMPKDLVDRRISTASVARIPPARTEQLARHRLIAGDIVYSRRGDVERFAVVSQRENGWLCGTGCLLVRPGPNWKSTAFLAETLDHPATREWIVRHAIGATMPNLNTGILGDVPLLVPTEPVLVAFEQMCASWQKKKEAADAESETLATLRDTLLPKLLSGELRVRDAERQVETAL